MIDKNEAISKSAQRVSATLIRNQPKEIRNKRMQIVVKPSTFARLEQLKRTGIIRSKNDLINNFLEHFVQQYTNDTPRKDDQ